MAGYNRVVMIGNLTRDPDYKQLASGQAVCRLGLATNRQFKNRQTGDMVQEVCFVDIDVWGAQAESCHQYLQKGRQVLIEGRLKLDTWEDQATGQNRSKHSIVADRVVFLSSQAEMETPAGSQEAKLDPSNEVEKELMDQIEQIKQRTQPKVAKETAAAEVKPATPAAKNTAESEKAETPESADKAPEVAFKDEPPFQDDLPF